jgi:hypothetical protein
MFHCTENYLIQRKWASAIFKNILNRTAHLCETVTEWVKFLRKLTIFLKVAFHNEALSQSTKFECYKCFQNGLEYTKTTTVPAACPSPAS